MCIIRPWWVKHPGLHQRCSDLIKYCFQVLLIPPYFHTLNNSSVHFETSICNKINSYYNFLQECKIEVRKNDNFPSCIRIFDFWLLHWHVMSRMTRPLRNMRTKALSLFMFINSFDSVFHNVEVKMMMLAYLRVKLLKSSVQHISTCKTCIDA